MRPNLNYNNSSTNNPKNIESSVSIGQVQPVHPNLDIAVAKFAFKAQKDKDLSFEVGDIIVVEKKRKNGWWVGSSNGKRGYFPNNYVEI